MEKLLTDAAQREFGARNRPEHFEEVRVRVLRPFCISGKPLKAGEVVALPRYLAVDVVAVLKAEYV